MTSGLWSQDEHAKFLIAIKLYPHGPWRQVAAYVGTRSIRQVQTHAQKYHEKVKRRMRGLHKGRRLAGRREHRIDDDMLAACKVGQGYGVVVPKRIDSSSSRLQHSNILALKSGEPLVPCLGVPYGSTSPDRVDSVPAPNGVTSCPPLPTLDESLDFLIENLFETAKR
ncbi:hypothetical protein PsorP6_011487 [Peronosclerospora sorghi]|uniref:Uncharacterized protein n=1 Tax=Peronosclerospora sorghi TaxID=230839 RepID=A0ACC0WJN3_9STRA|nr:hypothetical protein PsorP6_011487 [Peronosclerospora sorghi]